MSDTATGEQRSWLRRRRRRLLLMGVPLLALTVIAAVSWHFSDAVLIPDHSDWPRDISVKRLQGGQVVLSRTEASVRPGVYGLQWPGGHTIVGEVSSSSDSSVTRPLQTLTGKLMAGSKVALDPNTYEGNPRQALGLRFENVKVPDELGPMPAWLIPGKTNTWAIFVHGINGSRENGLRMVPPLHRAGLSVLMITYREDVGSPASPDGFHHMGLTEWRDLEAAARYALSRGAKRLVLVGASMGGAIVSQFMERSSLARRVAALVLDAPALSWKAILSFNAKEMHLPSFAVLPVEWIIGERINADWGSLDALDHPDSFKLPILLFHGTDDELVPISTSDAFAKELPKWVTYYRVPRAGHTLSWNVNPALYDRRVTAFLRRATISPVPAARGVAPVTR